MQDLEGAALEVLQAAEAVKAELQVKAASLHSSHQDYERKLAEVGLLAPAAQAQGLNGIADGSGHPLQVGIIRNVEVELQAAGEKVQEAAKIEQDKMRK